MKEKTPKRVAVRSPHKAQQEARGRLEQSQSLSKLNLDKMHQLLPAGTGASSLEDALDINGIDSELSSVSSTRGSRPK